MRLTLRKDTTFDLPPARNARKWQLAKEEAARQGRGGDIREIINIYTLMALLPTYKSVPAMRLKARIQKAAEGGKARAGHKYIKRERKGERWQYTYAQPGDAPTAPRASPPIAAKPSPGDHQKQVHALVYYQTGDSFEMQNYLRGSVDAKHLSDRSVGEIKDKIKHLDAMIVAHPLRQDVTLYRGARNLALSNLQAGDEFDDPGFCSTSSDPKKAEWFARTASINIPLSEPAETRKIRDTVLLTIEMRKGQKALNVNAHSSEQQTEKEFLLPRGTKMRVVHVGPKIPGEPRAITVKVVE